MGRVAALGIRIGLCRKIQRQTPFLIAMGKLKILLVKKPSTITSVYNNVMSRNVFAKRHSLKRMFVQRRHPLTGETQWVLTNDLNGFLYFPNSNNDKA